ncbi:MAG TPA: aerial mycelium formation protein [Actinocrinis sp.]|jgi:hypothetical protein
MTEAESGRRGLRRIDRVTAEGFAADLGALPLRELRERRADALAEEADLSYLRRLLHGRIDIIAAELDRRRLGDTSPLLAGLTAILADPPPERPVSARHLRLNGPVRDRPGEYRAEIEGRLSKLARPDLAGCPEPELGATARALADCERELSGLRQQVQRAADECAAELARRYRDGEAAVGDVLDAH